MSKNKILLCTGFLFLSAAAYTDEEEGKKEWLKKIGRTMASSEKDHAAEPVAGVRGLQEGEREVDTQARDYAAIERLEKISISDKELGDFLKEGILHP